MAELMIYDPTEEPCITVAYTVEQLQTVEAILAQAYQAELDKRGRGSMHGSEEIRGREAALGAALLAIQDGLELFKQWKETCADAAVRPA